MSAVFHVGFFGKVPNLGDFVERRLHAGFRSVWDQWVQESLALSQESLGERWLELYVVSPLWRFVLSPRVCGEAVYAGVMVPSVDRVGRYFPLTVVATLPAETPCLPLFAAGRTWFAAVESILMEVLHGQLTDIDGLERLLGDLEQGLPEVVRRLPCVTPARHDLGLVAVLGNNELTQGLTGVSELLLRERFGNPTYWDTDGSVEMSPRLLVAAGLPQPTAFAAMLSGRFEPTQWRIVEQFPTDPAAVPRRPLAGSARSDRGHVRELNEDYALSRPDLGLWAVADGMGGYQDGALASAAVCDSLESVDLKGTLREKVELSIAALRGVNQRLRAESDRLEQRISSASTVVLLLVAADEWACVWAGDSRLYRLRADSLEQISHDHAVGERSATGSPAEAYFVTAGVGVEDALTVDVLYGDAQAGDRFLLCSDGLYEGVEVADIVRCLSRADPHAATHELMRAVLAGRAPDNATAIAVFMA